ncbi:KH domain-containing, RNA-binding, signal transduction-associated protein 3-like isoform X2 [Eurosta solidaginis]|uniref:KH domain-containing, RNA-binding, signal transduction-associated protein 3-like isoform X2 n=1 Tax=Eurosta solidaginis TaxID=178769 RepID=UPI0035308994
MVESAGESNEAPKIENNDGPRINGVAQKFLADMNKERERLGNEFPLCGLLIDEAFNRVYATGRIPGTELLADVYMQRPIKVIQKVYIPVKQFPKFNFTGKLLGPKGNSLRRLHAETQCKIFIKGRGSMRDRNKEEELRQSNDPRHAHFHRNLFIEISTVAPPAEAHARVAYALAELRKYLTPDKNDDVSQEQLRELMEIDPKSAQSYSKTVLGKYPTRGDSKFIKLIKRNATEVDMEESDDGYAYHGRYLRRAVVSPYGKVFQSTAPAKRPPTSFEESGYKRIREPPVKIYKPIYKTILSKYK